MSNKGNSSGTWVLAVAAVLVALWGVSCGDSDDDGGSAGAPSGETQAASGGRQPVDASQEDQVRAAYVRYVKTFYSKDPDAICDLLSQKAQRAWVSGDSRNCEEGVRTFFESSLGPIDTRPKITGIKINGSRATVSTSKKGKPTSPGLLVKEDGQWKLTR